MNEHAAELSLLCIAARMQLEKPATSLLAEFDEGIDWPFLVETAYAHGVAGLLCHSLLKMPAALVPNDIAQACAAHLRQREQANQGLATQLSGVLTALQAQGIEAIPFKGPVLAMTAYGRLGLRAFRDLDFLVRPEEAGRCLAALAALGYAHDQGLTPRQTRAFHRYGGQDILFGPGLPVEPHWAFAPHTLAIDIDYDGIWQRAQRASFNGRAIARLAPEDELILLCIHGAKEKWTQLKWVVDLTEFVRRHPDLDWQAVTARSEAQGVARLTRLGLGLARELLQVQLPPEIESWIDADAVAPDWSRTLAATFFDRPDETGNSVWAPCRFHWRMRERRCDRLRYLVRTVTQPRIQHFHSVAIPDALFFLYRPYKLLHDYLMLPLWLLVRGLARRTPGKAA